MMSTLRAPPSWPMTVRTPPRLADRRRAGRGMLGAQFLKIVEEPRRACALAPKHRRCTPIRANSSRERNNEPIALTLRDDRLRTSARSALGAHTEPAFEIAAVREPVEQRHPEVGRRVARRRPSRDERAGSLRKQLDPLAAIKAFRLDERAPPRIARNRPSCHFSTRPRQPARFFGAGPVGPAYARSLGGLRCGLRGATPISRGIEHVQLRSLAGQVHSSRTGQALQECGEREIFRAPANPQRRRSCNRPTCQLTKRLPAAHRLCCRGPHLILPSLKALPRAPPALRPRSRRRWTVPPGRFPAAVHGDMAEPWCRCARS